MADYSSYRTEIDPTDRQKKILDKNFDACRKIFNLYLSRAMEQYDKTGKYENVEEFVDWFYKIYMRSQKLSCGFPRGFNNVSIKKVCRNVNIIMDRYASRKIGRPRSKSEKYGRASLYFANINIFLLYRRILCLDQNYSLQFFRYFLGSIFLLGIFLDVLLLIPL